METGTKQAPPQRRGWTGNSNETLDGNAMLGAKWWAVGDKLLCLWQRSFETKFGTGHQFMLVQPETLTVFVDQFGVSYKKQPKDDVEGTDISVSRFSLPHLAGFDLALQALESKGFPGFWFGARCIVKCIAMKEATQFGYSDMPVFELSVDPR